MIKLLIVHVVEPEKKNQLAWKLSDEHYIEKQLNH
jgi:hypothetical protein